jgi:serine/threonine protein phosphatase PrpC
MVNYTELLKISNGITTTEELYNELKSENFSYISNLYEQADTELATQDNFDYKSSGTTCNIIFQFNKHLVCASVGDSRGILIYDKGDNSNQGIFLLSQDHKPNLPAESERIALCGGVVNIIQDEYGNKIGPPRVFKAGCSHPGLAMSRSLGDIDAKEVGVISTPQIIEYNINPSTKFMVVCSDGVWEFGTNEQVRDLGNIFYALNDVTGFCQELIRVSISSWEQYETIRDDISVVSVFF